MYVIYILIFNSSYPCIFPACVCSIHKYTLAYACHESIDSRKNNIRTAVNWPKTKKDGASRQIGF